MTVESSFPWHFVCLGLAGILLGVEVGIAVISLPVSAGHDYRLYMDAASSWLSGGPFYHPYQLAGPYRIIDSEVLYPPLALWLLVPFTLLPAFLWWGVPIGVIAWCAWSWRPSGLSAAAAMVLLCVPLNAAGYGTGLDIVANGNPALWCVAFVALALRTGWAGPLILLKPTLAPFALTGIRQHPRAWVAGLAVVAAGSLALLPMWSDYARVLLNAHGGRDVWYTLGGWPFMLIPVVLWAGRRGSSASSWRSMNGSRRWPTSP